MPAYSRTQIILHWAVVVLISIQYLFHDGMESAWRSFRQTGQADPTIGTWLHIGAGVGVLVLALWRIALHVARPVPPHDADTPAWMARVAGLTHWAIYAVLLLAPVSGGVAWFLGVTDAADGHEVLTSVLMILIVLHVAAALYHQFVLRDGLIARMMRARG